VFCRCQQPTPQLLPAGATLAGWDIFLPLDQRAPFTAHGICGLASHLVRRRFSRESVVFFFSKANSIWHNIGQTPIKTGCILS
jgi:hypothetical protein